jgi:hypothetical protein
MTMENILDGVSAGVDANPSVKAPAGRVLLGGLVLGSVISEMIFATVLTFTPGTSLAYLPVIVTFESLVALVIGSVGGGLAVAIISRAWRSSPVGPIGMVLPALPFLALWIAYSFVVVDLGSLRALYIVLGVVTAAATIGIAKRGLVRYRVRNLWVVLTLVIAVVLTFVYPWVLTAWAPITPT